jgi:hypothetical protein
MKRSVAIIVSCALVACSSSNKIPDDIIGIDKMKLILWDMIRAGKLAEIQYEGNKYKIRKDSAAIRKDSFNMKETSIGYFDQIFVIHHITKDEFYKSYRYYEEHPDKNEILMDSVSAYASRQRETLYKRIQ